MVILRDNPMILRVPIRELEVVGVPAESKKPGLSRRAAGGSDTAAASIASQSAMLRSLEALRFGIVPREALERLTIGFDPLEQWVIARLPDADDGLPTISEVCGAFGTGKSHTMAAIRQIAVKRNFLTAHVEVDGNGVTLSDPLGLLFNLWATLTAGGLQSANPLVELNMRAIDRGAVAAEAALDVFPRVYANHETIRYLRTHGALEPFEERLEAVMACSQQEPATAIRQEILSDLNSRGLPHYETREHVQPTRMVGIKVEERPGDFADCLLGYAALARVAGYAGVVVTVDEFEVEYQSSQERLNRISLLAATLAFRLHADESRGAPLALFFATVGQEGHLGDAIVKVMLGTDGGDHADSRRKLRAWPAKNLTDLAGRIHKIYCEAYSASSLYDKAEAQALAEAAGEEGSEASGQIRAFIKAYVARLDARLGPPCV